VSKLSKVLSLFYPTSSSHSKAGNTTAADNTLQINAGIANDWGEFLASLNRSLDPLDLELSRIRNEVTGKEMYALVRRRFALPELPNNHPHVVNVEYGSRSIVGTMKSLVSRATIRPSRYPTSEHWYGTGRVQYYRVLLTSRSRSNKSCSPQTARTPSLP
jgi:hypothetical protein